MLIKTDKDIIAGYAADSSNLKGGWADALYVPSTEEELREVIARANSEGVPVTFSGGGTGTAGARIPFGGWIVSMERLNTICGTFKMGSRASVTAQAGVLIKDLKEKADKEGYFYTYDPTEQTAFTGGTIATNASGARSFRYGSTRRSVTALNLLLADGTPLNIRRGDILAKGREIRFSQGEKRYVINLPGYNMPATKSSAGYFAADNMDLIDLFIGQEGTLACITEAEFSLPPKPEGIISALAFFKTEEDALSFAHDVRDMSLSNRDAGKKAIDALSLEYFDVNSVRLLGEKYGGIKNKDGGAVFFEQEYGADTIESVLESWIAALAKYGVSENEPWVAVNDQERKKLIEKRHFMPEAMNDMARRNNLPKISTDVAVPPAKAAEMERFYRKTGEESGMGYYIFGHIGDSHLHFDLMPRDREELELARKCALGVIKEGVRLGGTVSAEHGIGKVRREYLQIMYGKRAISQMRELKRVLDPKMILCRGNIFEC